MFDVYVEGATNPSLEAMRALAHAMAARYGVPAAEVHARLTQGRLRVKASIDRATAEVYLRDLEALGARVRIEPAGGEAPSQPAPGPGAPPAARAPTRSSLPPQPASRAPSSVLPPQPASRPSAPSVLPPQPASRPSAPSMLPPPPGPRPTRSLLPPPVAARPTRSSLAPPPDQTTLGALDQSGLLSLATLDDSPMPSAPSDGVLPASMGPAAARPEKPARSRNEPIDRFAPPELASPAPRVELADDELAYRARKHATVPPVAAEAAPPLARTATADAMRRSGSPAPAAAPGMPASGDPPRSRTPSLPASGDAPRSTTPSLPSGDAPHGAAPLSSAPDASPSSRGSPADVAPAARWPAAPPEPGGVLAALGRIPELASPRPRLVAGVVLAIVLGFVPAHLVASWRERSAFGAIDDRITAVQAAADNPDSYAALDAFRAEQIDAKRSARRRIALIALAIWAAAGAGLAYGWFARVPWDRQRSE